MQSCGGSQEVSVCVEGAGRGEGGERGGTGRLGHTTGSVRVWSDTIFIPDPKGVYLVIEKGTL